MRRKETRSQRVKDGLCRDFPSGVEIEEKTLTLIILVLVTREERVSSGSSVNH